MSDFRLTAKQEQAQEILASDAQHCALGGGSRSGKTFLLVRNTVMRALKAPGSRHAIFRLRFNAVKSSVVMDTFPKVMAVAFPGVNYNLNKTDWFAKFENGATYWFGGLDDKERTEKILGMEFATIHLNEASQIPFSSQGMAVTRLAQLVHQKVKNRSERVLKPRMYYDFNPPPKSHWTYKLFVSKVDIETGLPLPKPQDYVYFRINPEDNTENVSADYLDTLRSLSPRLQKRFLRGEFADANPSALFTEETIEKWRVLGGELPEFVRVVVGVDPSGSGDEDNADNDEIGIAVAALGTDGVAYVLEDSSVKAGPATWGRVATSAYDRHEANVIVGEKNYGGAMVEHTIQTARPRTPYKDVSASRGKHVRAEPFSSLYENGKVRHVGLFRQLEDELCAFSTHGYIGTGSPNRADALIWALSELFPGLTRAEKKVTKPIIAARGGSWMSR